ncbi:MAG: hypothetical protein Q8S84_00470 [bacterium]|nr:hypothetical protein [bacterium]MDP3380063.1 hypothetical protein [bacterium]
MIALSIQESHLESFLDTNEIASHLFHALPVLQILCVYVSGLSGRE